MRSQALVVLALVLGCGGEVVVEDATLLDEEANPGGDPGGFAIRDGCLACSAGDCGWCAYEGEDVFQCRGDLPPAGGGLCVQTGNVYRDDDGLYICWRCSQ